MMKIGPTQSQSKIIKKLIESNPQDAIEKLNGINNKTQERMKELFGTNLAMLFAFFIYGATAWISFSSIKPIESAGIMTLFMWSAITTVGASNFIFDQGFSGLMRSASIFFRNYKLVGLNIRYKDLLLDEKENSSDPALKEISSDDYHSLMEMFHHFKLNADPNEEVSDEIFLETLIREKQFDKLLTLIKLLPESIEEYDALLACTPGRHSLQWQCGKALCKLITQNKIQEEDINNVDVVNLLEVIKKYA